MSTESNTNTHNILEQYYRRPEIYVTLPSNGQFYPEGTLESSATGELPVYGMTAKDDIFLKTPDALISGEAVVQVIKSCIPSIKDPWEMPITDVDYALIAIRIASYGEEMTMESTCTNCQHEHALGIDLTHYIEKLGSITIDTDQSTIEYNELKIHIKPLSYHELSLLQRKAFEEQRVLQLAQDSEEMEEEERQKIYTDILTNMTEINISMISSAIQGIELPEGELIVNKEEIVKFIDNSNVKLFNKITEVIESIREKTVIPPINSECPECKHPFEFPLIFNYSSFFA